MNEHGDIYANDPELIPPEDEDRLEAWERDLADLIDARRGDPEFAEHLVAARRRDPEFMARVERRHVEERELFERLASTGDGE